MKLKSFLLILSLIYPINAYTQAYYASIDFGSKNHDLGVSIISGGGSSTSNTDTIELTIGSKMNNKFSIEGSYIDFGGVTVDINNSQGAEFSLGNGYTYIASADIDKVSNAKYETNAILLGAKYNIYSDITRLGVGHIYLSGGLSFWNSDFTSSNYTRYGNGLEINDAVASNATSDSGITPYIGIGYEWNISDRINFHIDFTRYDIDNKVNNSGSIGIRILSF